MRDMNDQASASSRAKFKQRIAGAAVLIIVLAIFLPFIFNHNHQAASEAKTTPAATDLQTAQTDGMAQNTAAQQTAAQADQSAQPLDQSAAQQNEMAAADQNAASPALAATTAPDGRPDRASEPTLTTNQTEPTAANANAPAAAPAANTAADQTAAPVANQMAAQPTDQTAAPAAQAVAPAPAITQQHAATKPAPHAAHHAPITAHHTTAAMAQGHWTVQVASFSEMANAQQLVNKLRARDIHAYMQNDTAHYLVRVFVGPAASQKQAQRLQQQVKVEFQLNGIVKEKR